LVIGIGFGMQIATIVFAAVWPVLLNAAAATRGVPAARRESATLLGLSRVQRFFKVILPSLAPGILLGVTIAAPIAIVIALLAETLPSLPGLGSLLLQSQRVFRSSQVFALLVIIGILGYVLNAAIVGIRAYLLRNWPESSRR